MNGEGGGGTNERVVVPHTVFQYNPVLRRNGDAVPLEPGEFRRHDRPPKIVRPKARAVGREKGGDALGLRDRFGAPDREGYALLPNRALCQKFRRHFREGFAAPFERASLKRRPRRRNPEKVSRDAPFRCAAALERGALELGTEPLERLPIEGFRKDGAPDG